MEQLPIENGIYKHYKKGNYYRVVSISYAVESGKPIVNYYKCDQNGIFQRIYEPSSGTTIFSNWFGATHMHWIKLNPDIVKQPFARYAHDFMALVDGKPKFEFVKLAR